MNFLDNYLNTVTMHRLTVYVLLILWVTAGTFSLFGLLPFSLLSLILSFGFLFIITRSTNFIFAKVYAAHTNPDSTLISALILALIITPARSLHELGFLFWAAVWTSASKYIFALKNKHIFNPVAIGMVVTSLFLGGSATWWVGTLPMLPFVLAGGLLIFKKIKHNGLVLSFFLTAGFIISLFSVLNGRNLTSAISRTIVGTPLLFFGFIMLTEPITIPPGFNLQVIYGALAGLLFVPQIHLASLYTTPEIALVLANAFSYLAGPKFRLLFHQPQFSATSSPPGPPSQSNLS